MKAYCVSPSCPFIAEEGSERCAICNGHVKRNKNGFVVWESKKKEIGENKKEAENVV